MGYVMKIALSSDSKGAAIYHTQHSFIFDLLHCNLLKLIILFIS